MLCSCQCFPWPKGPTCHWHWHWQDKALNWQVNNLDSIIDSPPGPMPQMTAWKASTMSAQITRGPYIRNPPPHTHTHPLTHTWIGRTRILGRRRMWLFVCVSTKSLLTCRRQQLGIPGKCSSPYLRSDVRSADWQIFQLFFHFVQWNVARASRWNFYAIWRNNDGKQKRIYKSHPANTK